jgi:hypothetical protein
MMDCDFKRRIKAVARGRLAKGKAGRGVRKAGSDARRPAA